MKKDIHPKYHTAKVVCTSCGTEFLTGSTKEEIKVDTCSNCHAFYTGKSTITQADGRIDKFRKRYNIDSNKE